jgi:hypothetical protein
MIEKDMQNTDLPSRRLPLAEVSQRGRYQLPFHEKRSTMFHVLIGSLVVVVLLIGISGGLYLEKQDSRTNQIDISQIPSVPTVSIVSSIHESALLTPDLTVLLKLLNSDDPNTQEGGIAPMMRKGPRGTHGLLPTGSKVQVMLETWTVLNVDEKNEPYVAWIQALVTVPSDKTPRHYDLHLIHVEDQWLLYSTSKR